MRSRQWFSKLTEKLPGVGSMKRDILIVDGREAYKHAVAENEKLIKDTYTEILIRIEKACRTQSEIIVNDLGFECMSTPLYPTSFQSKVVDKLSLDGYVCVVNINYDAGKVSSSLKIKW